MTRNIKLGPEWIPLEEAKRLCGVGDSVHRVWDDIPPLRNIPRIRIEQGTKRSRPWFYLPALKKALASGKETPSNPTSGASQDSLVTVRQANKILGFEPRSTALYYGGLQNRYGLIPAATQPLRFSRSAVEAAARGSLFDTAPPQITAEPTPGAPFGNDLDVLLTVLKSLGYSLAPKSGASGC